MRTHDATAVPGFATADGRPCLLPAPHEGRAWFLPLVGEWYRLRDRLDRRLPGAAGPASEERRWPTT